MSRGEDIREEVKIVDERRGKEKTDEEKKRKEKREYSRKEERT